MKRVLCVLAAVSAMSGAVTAAPFTVNQLGDGIALGTGAVFSLGSIFLEPEPVPFDGTVLSPDRLNDLDKLIVKPYSGALDFTSDFSQYAAFLSPAVLAFGVDKGEWFGIGVMYAEAAMFSFGCKNALKDLVFRERPYMYFDSPPADAIVDGDYGRSFPSGHATMAFTGAAFASYVFCAYNPDSPWRLPLVAGSYSLALATAALRIASGNHFITDVLAGAAIGTVSGIIVPWLHTLNAKNGSMALNVTGESILFKVAL